MKVVEIKDINQRIKGNSLKVLNVDVAFRNPFKVNKKILQNL